MSRKDTRESGAGGSRRDRERRARFALIRGAAAQVFARHGYDAATMEMVARAAELGKATLYYYFPTKQQLFADIVVAAAHTLEEMTAQELADVPAGDRSAALDALARILIEFFRRHTDLAVLLLPLHASGHGGVEAPLDEGTARVVMEAHRPLLQILEPFAAEVRGGEVLPGWVGSLLLGLAAKVQRGGGAVSAAAVVGGEVELTCNLLRRLGAKE